MATPHRLDHYEVIWTKPQHGGLFFHFNRFRYSGSYAHTKGENGELRAWVGRCLDNLFALGVGGVGEGGVVGGRGRMRGR